VRTAFSQITFRPLCPRCGKNRYSDGGRICATGYDRTHGATMPLEKLKFKLKPAAALHI